MEDPIPGPSASGIAEPQSGVWDMSNSLIDRILQEGSFLHSHRTKSNTEAFDKGLNRSLPSSHRKEVSRHHQRVSERICVSKQTYPTLSPYVRRHKIISQLMGFHEPKVKHSSRRLRKLRAKPLLDISDWGLSDDSVSEDDFQNDHVVEVTDNVPDITQKGCRNNETSSDVQFVQSTFCDLQSKADVPNDTCLSGKDHCRGRQVTGELASLSKCDEMDTDDSPTDCVIPKEVSSLDWCTKNSSLTREIDLNFGKAYTLAATLDGQTVCKTHLGSYENNDNVYSGIYITDTRCVKNKTINDAIRWTMGLKKEHQRFIDNAKTENSLGLVDGHHTAKHTTNAVYTTDEVVKSINPFKALTEQSGRYSGMSSNMTSHQSSEGSDTNIHSNVLSSSHHSESPTCSSPVLDLNYTKSTISK